MEGFRFLANITFLQVLFTRTKSQGSVIDPPRTPPHPPPNLRPVTPSVVGDASLQAACVWPEIQPGVFGWNLVISALIWGWKTTLWYVIKNIRLSYVNQ